MYLNKNALENTFGFIKSTFLQLTSRTYPYGTEDGLVEEMITKNIFPNLEKDLWGNYFIKIGTSRTLFTAHLDTACRDQVSVRHIISPQQIVKTDGTSILGADDKAGVSILLFMIKNKIPGLYYFFIGEEVGCIGSSAASVYGIFKDYDRCISFDRRGTNSVITFQSSYRSCSDDFAKELSSQLNKTKNMYYRPDDTGVYTDSAEFVDIIPECTNISVGYYSEHTTQESQDLYHLHKLALACLNVEWENLPTKRIFGSRESKYAYTASSRTTWDTSLNYSGYNEGMTSGRRKKRSRHGGRSRKTNTTYFVDTKPSRTFYDNRGELVEFSNTSKNPGVYDIMIEKFLASELTREELKIVSEQYLDMSNSDDVKLYEDIYYHL